MTTNNIKAVEMTRQIRDEIYEQIKDKTPAERLAFYREQARAFYDQNGIHRLSKTEDTHNSTSTPLHTSKDD
jgi:hypothetical protein